MLIEYEDLIDFLIRNTFISSEDIVDNTLSIENISVRNCNLKIVSGSGINYFLKHDIRISEEDKENKNLASIAYEAEVYKLFEKIFNDTGVHYCVPRFHAFDSTEKVLVLDAIPNSVNLGEHYVSKARFSPVISENLGRTLAEMHKESASKKKIIERSIGTSDNPPWIFLIAHPDQWLYINSSPANLELISIIQRSPEISNSIEKLRQQWEPSCLMHGDIKFVNCLITTNNGTGSKSKIYIVDWELARIGDPCWDIGSVFSEYLNIWLSSIPISLQHSPDEFLDFAQFPLKKIQPAIGSFWKSYSHYSEIDNDKLLEYLLRSTSFAALRLIQSAYEQSQSQSKMSTKVVFLLQLSANILQRPLEAIIQLLGLSISNFPYGRS